MLTMECIEKGKQQNYKCLILHSTKYMQTAINMYEKIGFVLLTKTFKQVFTGNRHS